MNGAPANPISGVGPSRGEDPHGLRDIRDVVGRQLGQAIEVGAGADRLGHHRADAGDDVEVDTDGGERHDDVGEEDRGVDAVPAHRLEGDLGDGSGAGTTPAWGCPRGPGGTRQSARPAA